MPPAARLLAVPLVVFLVACTSAAPTRPNSATPAATRSPAPSTAVPTGQPAQTPPMRLAVRHAYTAISTTHAPYYIAEAAGYFAEEGLDMQITYISGSSTAMQALVAGELDSLNATGGAAVQARTRGSDLTIYANTVGTLFTQFITAPDITQPAQLRGQPVGIVRFGTISDFTARLFLKGWGYEPGTDVPLLQLGGQSQIVGALQSGQVRAVVLPDVQAIEVKRLGYRELADAADLGREYVGQGLILRERTAADNPELLRRLLRALARGMGRFLNDREFSVSVIQQRVGIDAREVVEESWELHAQRYANRSLLTTPEAVRTVLEELADDPAVRNATPESFYDNRFVQELHDSGFLARAYGS
jgi:NitT/TauT family transport system substrate-binding protein